LARPPSLSHVPSDSVNALRLRSVSVMTRSIKTDAHHSRRSRAPALNPPPHSDSRPSIGVPGRPSPRPAPSIWAVYHMPSILHSAPACRRDTKAVHPYVHPPRRSSPNYDPPRHVQPPIPMCGVHRVSDAHPPPSTPPTCPCRDKKPLSSRVVFFHLYRPFPRALPLTALYIVLFCSHLHTLRSRAPALACPSYSIVPSTSALTVHS
jgi:hypothetical protein